MKLTGFRPPCEKYILHSLDQLAASNSDVKPDIKVFKSGFQINQEKT
jgi:hypothetical protein